MQLADQRNCASIVNAFETIAGASKAVMCCPITKLVPLAIGIFDLLPTYYELEALRFENRSSGTEDWATIRPKAEIDLFDSDSYKHLIHYAALSIDNSGLSNYGNCTVILSDEMIGHRASVFQENSAIYFQQNPGASATGFRSNWIERAKLCVAKLADRLTTDNSDADFSRLLLFSGNSSTLDEFVEVQIFGTITIRTFAEVKVHRDVFLRSDTGQIYSRVLAEKLAAAGVNTEVI